MIPTGLTLTETWVKRQNKKSSTSFRTKNTAFNKNHPDEFGVAALKMVRKYNLKIFRK
jgi:hypothetical protein